MCDKLTAGKFSDTANRSRQNQVVKKGFFIGMRKHIHKKHAEKRLSAKQRRDLEC